MLREMTSRQLAEWEAYATIEPIGNPVDVVPPEKQRKVRRAKVEAGFKSLMEKQNGRFR